MTYDLNAIVLGPVSCSLLSGYERLLSAKKVTIQTIYVAFHVTYLDYAVDAIHYLAYATVNPLSTSQTISKWRHYDWCARTEYFYSNPVMTFMLVHSIICFQGFVYCFDTDTLSNSHFHSLTLNCRSQCHVLFRHNHSRMQLAGWYLQYYKMTSEGATADGFFLQWRQTRSLSKKNIIESNSAIFITLRVFPVNARGHFRYAGTYGDTSQTTAETNAA